MHIPINKDSSRAPAPALDSCLIALVKAITENPEDAYVSHAVHFIVNILRILRKMPF